MLTLKDVSFVNTGTSVDAILAILGDADNAGMCYNRKGWGDDPDIKIIIMTIIIIMQSI